MSIDPFKPLLEIEEKEGNFLKGLKNEFISFVQNKFPKEKEQVLFIQRLVSHKFLVGLISKKLRISEKVLYESVRKVLSENEEVKSIALALHGNCIDAITEVIVRGKPYIVTFRVVKIKTKFSTEAKEIYFTLAEVPKMETKSFFKNLLLSLSSSLIVSICGKDKVIEVLLKNLEGASVSGNEITIDLKKASFKEIVEAEILGVHILDLVYINKVEIKEDEVVIYGGLKVPYGN